MERICLQEHFAPHNACFGCGPQNEKGLRLRSIPNGDVVEATWQGQVHHEAFPGMLSGGIIGTLLDCHSNWSSAYYLMKEQGLDKPPCTVTAFYNVKLLRPTPSTKPITLKARAMDIKEDRVKVEADLECDGQVCATCEGLFVAVKPGHPAYHRW